MSISIPLYTTQPKFPSTEKEMNDVDRAVQLITNGEPIPLDLFASLMGQGIDVSELERKYER